MPFSTRTRPSLTSSSSSPRDSFDLPDYYRTTRSEKYGPYYRTAEPAWDFLTTIDLRSRESAERDIDSPLPDILELEEEEKDAQLVLEGRSRRDNNVKPAYDLDQHRHEDRAKQVSWVAHLLSALRKYCMFKTGRR